MFEHKKQEMLIHKNGITDFNCEITKSKAFENTYNLQTEIQRTLKCKVV